ncbi:uroporphyrin-III C-methyltransferase [Rhizoclosmatium hyalinum]|nr:uroporphyrin-III C-methyltransferase [Rhizoclosmatium hyalinum]
MQVRFEVLNSGYHGSAQDRNRVIIIVAAKDKVLPEFPVASHYFDNKNKLIGSFIKTPDGLSQAGMKPVLSAPCRQITVNDCIGGLPPAVPYNQKPNPPLHFIDGAQEDAIPDKYRLKLNGMFRTITNSVIKNSPRYHPTENRMLSLYERARAQGFSDTDIEKLYDEYGREQLATKNRNALSKQIGNAVPRELAFAIGCAINFSLDQQQ